MSKSNILVCSNCLLLWKNARRKFRRNGVGKYFYHNILTFCSPSIEEHELAKLQQKIFRNQVVQPLRRQKAAALFSSRRSEKSLERSRFSVLPFADYLRIFGQASKCSHIPLPKPKTAMGYTMSKDLVSGHYSKDINEQRKRGFDIAPI